jgi:hypothetical protein
MAEQTISVEKNHGPIRIRKFVERHRDEGWTEPALRWIIFKAHENGLDDAGAILRVGKRVFVDEARFFGWLRAQRAGGGVAVR